MDTTPKPCPRCMSSPDRLRSGRAAEVLRALASLPGAAPPLLPSLSRPACIAAYAGVLVALLFGFLLADEMLRPLILGALALGVASIGWTIRPRGRAEPLALAGVSALLFASGRRVWSPPPVVYVGATALLFAAGWNLRLCLSAKRKEVAA